MIAKPTTEQILNECSRELIEMVLPAVTDDAVKVTVLMMDWCCATRRSGPPTRSRG